MKKTFLSTVLKLGGASDKANVLDYLANNDLINLRDEDETVLKSRKEVKWRNELAYVRRHLVEIAVLYQHEWAITEAGKVYYNLLVKTLRERPSDCILQRIKEPVVFEYINISETNHDPKEDIKQAESVSEYGALVKCRKG